MVEGRNEATLQKKISAVGLSFPRGVVRIHAVTQREQFMRSLLKTVLETERSLLFSQTERSRSYALRQCTETPLGSLDLLAPVA